MNTKSIYFALWICFDKTAHENIETIFASDDDGFARALILRPV